jgi:hypothetical protein
MLPAQLLSVDVCCGQITDEIVARCCSALREKGVAIVEDLADGSSANRLITGADPHQPDHPIREALLIVPRHIEYPRQDSDRQVLSEVLYHVAPSTFNERIDQRSGLRPDERLQFV